MVVSALDVVEGVGVRGMVGVDSEDKEIVAVICVLEMGNKDTLTSLLDIFKGVEALGVVAELEVVEIGRDDKTVEVVCAFKFKELSVAPVNKELASNYTCNGKRPHIMASISFNIPTG